MSEPLTELDRLDILITAQSESFEAGYAKGWHDGRQDAQNAARQSHAAGIALDHLKVHQARQKAAGGGGR